MADIVNFNLSSNLSLLDGYEDDSQGIKFDLYLLTREMRQVIDKLKPITDLSTEEQKKWMKEHREMLEGYVGELVQTVMEVFTDTDLDQEVMQEAVSCVTELRQLLVTLSSLVGETG